jgi:DnaK suppressor protein
MLTKKKMADFRKMLQGRLGELLDEADQAVKDISDSNADVSSDPTDQAVQELDRSRLLRLKDRERKLIRKIEKAIVKIEDGTYGQCDACSADIAEARLKARPMTNLCIDCATEMESEKQKSKLFGGEEGGEAAG